ncbi:MAG: S8 family serine peptidase [Gammaproteobacteria bacterium]|nr:S8 family serine peptidase [Gammaproteobacteria bacterium]
MTYTNKTNKRWIEGRAARVMACALIGAGSALAPPLLAQTDDNDAAWVGSHLDLRAAPSQIQFDQRSQNHASHISNLENNAAQQETLLRQAQAALDSAATPWREARDAYMQAVAAAEQSPWDNSLKSAVRSAYESYERAVAAANSSGAAGSALREDVANAEVSLTVARVRLFFGNLNRQRFEYDYDAHQKGWESAAELQSIADCLKSPRPLHCTPGVFGNPAGGGFLHTSKRLTLFQPTLALVNAHHAYALGASGKGVRIGIEDDGVNYRLSEFEGRVSFDGAILTYPIYGERDLRRLDAQNCSPSASDCHVFAHEGIDPPWATEGMDPQQMKARSVILEYGWAPPDPDTAADFDFYPVEDDSGKFWTPEHSNWYLEYTYPCANDPGSECVDYEILPSAGTHGTMVASVAAGRDFGIAPGATIIPVAKDFSTEGQAAERRHLESLIAVASPAARRAWDAENASEWNEFYSHFDIINRSYGISVDATSGILAFLRQLDNVEELFPQTWRALFQADRHPDERAILVYAAGNDTRRVSSVESDAPYWAPLARGHHLSVMAVGADGIYAPYSNFCGPLPADWDAASHGRHFCLAAPGSTLAAHPFQAEWAYFSQGTSFAAPIVSGAIALLMEHFRGQLGNTEIAKRIVNTADNTGRYAQAEIYGAGLLDLKAALQPVGKLSTGTSARNSDASTTLLSLPASIGALGARFASQGVEVASLDSLGAPFWASPARYMAVQPWNAPSLAPAFAEPAERGSAPHLGFTPGTLAIPLRAAAPLPASLSTAWKDFGSSPASTLRLLTGDGRLGLEQAPSIGFRWGFLRDSASWQGGQPSGAFGSRVHSSTVWTGRNFQHRLGQFWTATLSGTLALTRVDLPSGSMLKVEPHLMSTWELGIERGIRGEGHWSRLSLMQPLRAESGKGTLTYLAGLKGGATDYQMAAAPLSPQGREIELAFTYERPVGLGRAALKLARSFDFLHQQGVSAFSVGLAYRAPLPQ